MNRIARLGFVCGLAVAFAPATAFAQVFIPAQPAAGYGNSPFGALTPQRFQPYTGVQANTIYGQVTVGQAIPFNSPLNRVTNLPFQSWYTKPTAPAMVPWAPGGARVSTGYMSGGTSNTNIMQSAQREFDRAQRAATTARERAVPSAKNAVDEEWNYEKFGAVGLPGGLKAVTDHPDELIKALSITDEAELLSGQALNQILVAVNNAEAKGAKGPSAFIPPPVLAEVRFAGPPAAEAVNFLLQGAKLTFPVAFDDPKLKDVREELDKDYVAVATPLRDGKLPEPMKLMKLGFTIQRAQELASPVIRDLPFDDAVHARQFLNRLDVALVAFKAQNSFLMFNPAWTTEGGSVGDLVKHMTKFKLQFGPAVGDGGDSYMAMHKGLSTFLFVLTQPKK